MKIFNSATSSFGCHFVSTTVSKSYIIAGLTTMLWNPFTLPAVLLSQITLDTCTFFFTYSAPLCLLLWVGDSRYLNITTFTISNSCIVTFTSASLSFTCKYSMSFLLTLIPFLSSAYLHLLLDSARDQNVIPPLGKTQCLLFKVRLKTWGWISPNYKLDEHFFSIPTFLLIMCLYMTTAFYFAHSLFLTIISC